MESQSQASIKKLLFS